MRIVFATPLAPQSSTIIGRVLPLARELARTALDVHILILAPTKAGLSDEDLERSESVIAWCRVGTEPFTRTSNGKQRLGGSVLIFNMLSTSLRTAWQLWKLKPDVVVIVKPIPSNVLGVWLWHMMNKLNLFQNTRYQLILDVDDFELTANKLSSIWQRAAIHWAERISTKLADIIVTASPFLSDHFAQLANEKKHLEMIPTGISFASPPRVGGDQEVVDDFEEGMRKLAYFGSVSISSGHRVDLLPNILKLVRQKIPDATLLIAGDGDEVEQLKQDFEVKGLAHAVTWHGRFSLSEVEGLLQNVAVLVDPIDDSIANRAKSSFRVALAISVGLPVITANIGVRPHFLPQDFHDLFFAQPDDAPSYAQKIIAAVKNPLSDHETKQLRAHAMQFTWEQLAQKYAMAMLSPK